MASEGHGLRVLVVEDDSLLSWALSDTLTDAGCAVSQAIDGASALHAVAKATTPFDVVLLDYRLPDIDDLSLLARVHHRSPSSALLFMTAYGTPELLRSAREVGASGVLNKPFDMREVQHMVLLAGHRDHSTTH